MSRRIPILVVALAASMESCAPTARLAVRPAHVCGGTPVTAVLEANGCPELTTVPPVAAVPGRTPPTYIPTEDTLFTLTVSRWPHDPSVSQTEVAVMTSPGAPVDAEDDLPFTMECREGRLEGRLQRPLEDWDSRLRVTTLTTDGSRDTKIEHEGRTELVTASHSTTDAFQGTHLGGSWTLSTPLLPGERCGEPASAPPDRIFVTAGVSCME